MREWICVVRPQLIGFQMKWSTILSGNESHVCIHVRVCVCLYIGYMYIRTYICAYVRIWIQDVDSTSKQRRVPSGYLRDLKLFQIKKNSPLCHEWMNEWMKSYIAHVSSRRLFRALNIESKARPVIIQIPTQSPGRYTAELPLRRIKLFSF